MICNNCPRKCNVDRTKQTGFCKAPQTIKIAHVSTHFGEEPCISGSRGSGTIFFCHCNLHCVFCQNAPVRDGKIYKEVSPEGLANIFKRLESSGVHNINLVSPTQYSSQIVEAFKIYKPQIPVVYNTNGYESTEILEQLAPYVDVFLTDLKYVDENLSQKLSNCKNYFAVASKAIKKMRELVPHDKFENGILTKGVIVRHLVLPNCTKDSKRVIDFVANNLKGTTLSLMSQFVPCDQAEQFGLNRTLKPIEYNSVLRYATNKIVGEIYYQELGSATCELVPNWDPNTV